MYKLSYGRKISKQKLIYFLSEYQENVCSYCFENINLETD